jgi:YD repeat-containing protein
MQDFVVTDKLGRVTAIDYPSGRTASLDYNDGGELKLIDLQDSVWRQENGSWNRYKYDGKKIESFEGQMAVTADGDIVKITKNGEATIYHVDGTRTNISVDNSAVTVNPAGKPLAIVDATGWLASFTYGTDGRLQKLKLADRTWIKNGSEWQAENGDGKVVEKFNGTFLVNSSGDIQQIRTGGKSVIRHRDGSTTIISTDGSRVKRNAANAIIAVTYPDGQTNEFFYDDERRLNKILSEDGSYWVRVSDTSWERHNQSKTIDRLEGSVEIDPDGDIIAIDNGLMQITRANGKEESREI